MSLNPEQIAVVADYFANRPVLRAYLFGSQARKEATADSDVDILVDLDYSERIGLKFVQMKLDLEKILGSPVDLVSSQGLSPHIRPFVEAEKHLIYARG